MALTLRKKSGLIIPKSPTLILPNSVFNSTKNQSEEALIEKTIKTLIKNSVGISNRTAVRRLVFFPVYKKRNGEKEISRIYLNYKTRGSEKVVDVDIIEATGVTLLEFLDYIITNGAKEIKSAEKALEIM